MLFRGTREGESKMSESEYHVIELVGTSSDSWEKAALAAIETASKLLRDTRVAEIVKLDMKPNDDGTLVYRAKMRLSFKYHMIFSLTPKFHNNRNHW
jgi:flavin-binding protein dodecin